MRTQKKLFNTILALFAILLAALPFIVTFNELLTKLVERLRLYELVQEVIVPIEVKMVGVLVSMVGIDYGATKNIVSANGHLAEITWNCLGWQSILFLTITLYVGLKGKNYSLSSIIQTVIIGLFGTYLINLLRITFIVILLAYNQSLFSVVYHDYLAAAVTILWMFFFWWFSYSYILEERRVDLTSSDSSQAKA